MGFFDAFAKYYKGKVYEAILLDDCKKKLKKAGVLYRVTARIKKVCDSGNFGPTPTRHKYFIVKI